jgi:hypothetical protein
MESTIVTTFDGKKEDKNDCVFIRGKYYHKKRDCFLHDGIYYSPFSRYLVFDNESGKRVHRAAVKLVYGIIGFDKSGSPVLGYYTPNISKNGFIYIADKEESGRLSKLLNEASDDGIDSRTHGRTTSRYADHRDSSERSTETTTTEFNELHVNAPGLFLVPVMNIHQISGSGIIQCKNNDVVAREEEVKIYDKQSKVSFNKISAINPYTFELSYNCETMLKEFSNVFNPENFQIDDRTKVLAEHLHEYSFGIEYESWDGRIPTYTAAHNGLIPLRDGSLRHDNVCGFEYATVVLNGAHGLSAIKSQCKALSEYTEFNERCSMHIHVGNIPRTKENLCNIYKGIISIQDSLYKLFPSCLSRTSAYKQKDYCSPLPKISCNENSIVGFLSDGNEAFDKFGRHHPKDRNMQNKWHVNSRYHIVNLNNFYYTNRGTIELRISTPTYNHNKISALLLLFAEIINESINGRFYTDVFKLIKERFAGDIQEWMEQYFQFREKELSQWTTDKNNGAVKYYETMKNDKEIGCKRALY